MRSGIYFFKSKVHFRFSKKTAITQWIRSNIRKVHKKPGSINFVFCSDDFLLEMNKKYLKHNYYTDIITFDYSEKNIVNGEVYISIDRVKENAGLMEVSFQNELCRVVIHGVLHLLGFSDKTSSQKKQIRRKEDACLSLLFSST